MRVFYTAEKLRPRPPRSRSVTRPAAQPVFYGTEGHRFESSRELSPTLAQASRPTGPPARSRGDGDVRASDCFRRRGVTPAPRPLAQLLQRAGTSRRPGRSSRYCSCAQERQRSRWGASEAVEGCASGALTQWFGSDICGSSTSAAVWRFGGLAHVVVSRRFFRGLGRGDRALLLGCVSKGTLLLGRAQGGTLFERWHS